MSRRNSRKSPSKHDISGGRLKGNIDSFSCTSYRSCCFPGSRYCHIVPCRTSPTHAIRIRIGIENDKSEFITPRTTCQFYLKWSTSRRNIDIGGTRPARTVPDIIIRISSVVCDNYDGITRSLLILDIKSSVERCRIGIIDRISNSRECCRTSPSCSIKNLSLYLSSICHRNKYSLITSRRIAHLHIIEFCTSKSTRRLFRSPCTPIPETVFGSRSTIINSIIGHHSISRTIGMSGWNMWFDKFTSDIDNIVIFLSMVENIHDIPLSEMDKKSLKRQTPQSNTKNSVVDKKCTEK